MDQEVQMETVYYVSPPYTAEEEIATSYILKDDSISSERQEEVIDEDIPMNNDDISEDTKVIEEPADVPVVAEITEEPAAPTAADNVERPEVDKYTCKYCLKRFTKISNKQRHIRRIHNIKRGSETIIKCIECNLTFHHVYKLRTHLHKEHRLNMDEEELRFPNINAFKKWKCEIERKTLTSYTLRHGARKGPGGPKYFYACHRSGKYLPKVRGPRQRMIKTQGTCKLGIVCTAAILCQENADEVVVKYCPHHYGHGGETTLIQLSPEEQTAISASVSKGLKFESLLDEIRDGQASKDHFQLHLLKKKDMRSINGAYNCEDYNTEISDAESVDAWVQSCCQIENSPILFYRKEEFYNDSAEQEEFLLVIMTEFQKHILLSSSKNVVCVDSLYRKKGGRFYLTVLFVIDDNGLAFPVAFCISNKVDKNVILQFFHSICQSTGPLSFTYFMSDSESFYYDAWKEVMSDDSKWLWSMWYVDSKIRVQLRIFKGDTAKRAHVYKSMRMLLECQNQTIFQCMFENFLTSLVNEPHSKDLGNFINQHYGSNPEIWAYCYRKDIDLSTNIHLEIMHRTLRYCCRLGRKKRLDKFIFVLMKLVRDKMLDRLSNMMDEERINLAIDTINTCHKMGLEIDPNCISALTNKTWVIKTENDEGNVYVTRETETCPEHCSLRCEECDICVHNFTCSCIHSLINANLCEHIHAIVWNLLTPHFSPPPSPYHFENNVEENDRRQGNRRDCSELLQSVLKKTHEVYKRIQINKCNLSKSALGQIMKKMNECVDICSGKEIEEEKPPSSVVAPSSNTVSSNNTVLLLNPVAKENAQSVILNNQFPSILPNNMSQYVLLIPNEPKSS